MPTSTFSNLAEPKRARIIAAAISEFARAPYLQATLDNIAKEAQVAKGSLYQYFSGKIDLYRYLLVEVMPARKMHAIGLPTAGESVWHSFEQAFLAGFEFSLREPELTRLGVRLLQDAGQSPELGQIAAMQRKMGREWVAELLTKGQKQGEVSTSIDVSVAAPIVAFALGEGAVEQMALAVDKTREQFLAHPELSLELDAEQVSALVRSIIATLRGGLGVSSP